MNMLPCTSGAEDTDICFLTGAQCSTIVIGIITTSRFPGIRFIHRTALIDRC